MVEIWTGGKAMLHFRGVPQAKPMDTVRLAVAADVRVSNLVALVGSGKPVQTNGLRFQARQRGASKAAVLWVNVERIRVKDSFTHLWWLAPSDRPYADNRSVLQAYSDSMKELLRSGRYNSGKRPSGHKVGQKSFLRDNGGSIPSNVLNFSNTSSTDVYQETFYRSGNPLTGTSAHWDPAGKVMVLAYRNH